MGFISLRVMTQNAVL